MATNELVESTVSQTLAKNLAESLFSSNVVIQQIQDPETNELLTVFSVSAPNDDFAALLKLQRQWNREIRKQIPKLASQYTLDILMKD